MSLCGSLLSSKYATLKDAVKEFEQIRKGIYNILREENGREQPMHKHELDHKTASGGTDKAYPAARIFVFFTHMLHSLRVMLSIREYLLPFSAAHLLYL